MKNILLCILALIVALLPAEFLAAGIKISDPEYAEMLGIIWLLGLIAFINLSQIGFMRIIHGVAHIVRHTKDGIHKSFQPRSRQEHPYLNQSDDWSDWMD